MCLQLTTDSSVCAYDTDKYASDFVPTVKIVWCLEGP